MKIKIAFLTGQSNPNSVALSKIQTDFMNSIPINEEWKCYKNFPYTDGLEDFKPIHLFLASYYNSRQYLLSRTKKKSDYYKELFLKEFHEVENIVLIVGSCGLELFCNMNLSSAFLERISIFAYGPVSRNLPKCKNLLLVQGKKDYISRLWKLPIDRYVSCEHLDYLSNKEVVEIFLGFLHANLTIFPSV